MATSYFEHEDIAAVITEAKPFMPFFLQFFGMQYITDDRKIDFDKIPTDKRIAPFVSPRLQGKVIREKGFEVQVYKPGYIKDKAAIDPEHVFARRAGEPMGKPLTNAQRHAAIVGDQSVSMYERFQRRLEVMAAEFIRNGKYTMKGDELSVEVDFGRRANLTKALAGTRKWGLATQDAMQDFEDIFNLTVNNTGTMVFGSAAWANFTKDKGFDKAIIDNLQSGAQSTIQFSPMQMSDLNDAGVIRRGTLASAGCELYTYAGGYTDPKTGLEVKYMDPDEVIFIPSRNSGWQCYAAIWDDKANYTGMPYFFKNWSQEDPGTPFLMLQSSPMLAHTDINSFAVLKTQG